MERQKVALIILMLLSSVFFLLFPNSSYARDGYLQEDLTNNPYDNTQKKILSKDIQKKLDADYKAERKRNQSVTEKQEFTLDADIVTFDETSSIATATGHATVTDGSVTITAEKIVYYTNLNIVEGYTLSDGQEVIIKDATTELRGEHLHYDANLGLGELSIPHGSIDKMFFTAKNATSYKHSEAAKKGYVSKLRSQRLNPNSSVSVWENAKMTSCNAELPHYHLRSNRVIVIPGEKTIIKRPRLYYGKRLLFTYPFDITSGRKERKLSPKVGYSHELGGGVGLQGEFDFDNFGKLDVWGMAWFRDLTTPRLEAKFRYSVNIFNGVELYGQLNRLYNKRDEVIRWRPEYGLNFNKNGWHANLRVTKYELLSTRHRIGEEAVDHNLTRKPELSITTPSIYKGGLGQIYLKAIWGSYQEADFGQDNAPWFDRIGYGAQFTTPSTWKIWIFSPYLGADFMRYHYSSCNDTQQVWDAWAGLNYQVGAFLFNTSYSWRNVQGSSPMSWDRFSDNRNLLQSLAFKLPIGDANNKWFVALKGAYDTIIREIAEKTYILTFIRHCMTFQLWCKEYCTNYDLKFGFTFFIHAKPESMISFGSDDDSASYFAVPSSIDK